MVASHAASMIVGNACFSMLCQHLALYKHRKSNMSSAVLSFQYTLAPFNRKLTTRRTVLSMTPLPMESKECSQDSRTKMTLHTSCGFVAVYGNVSYNVAMKTTPLAVITGASEGLGKEFAQQLAAEGYNLLIIARRGHLLDELKANLEANDHVRVETLVCDLTKSEELKRVEDRLEKEESLEVMVNNAGFVFGNVFPDADPDLEETMIRLHILALMRLSRAALVPMCKRKKGYLINLSSVAAFFFGRDSVEYTATKGYALSFSKALQYDVRRFGVRVQALCPGFTRTAILSTELTKFFKKEDIPNWLWLTPEYVVRSSLNSIRRTSRVVCIPSLRYKIIVGLFGNSIGGGTLDFFSKIVGAPVKPGLDMKKD